jgi:hypothetical protein
MRKIRRRSKKNKRTEQKKKKKKKNNCLPLDIFWIWRACFSDSRVAVEANDFCWLLMALNSFTTPAVKNEKNEKNNKKIKSIVFVK